MTILSRPHLHATCVLVLALLASPMAGATCSLGVQGVNFGNYEFMSSQDLNSVGHVTVTCDATSSFSISLSTGAGSYASRTMYSGPHPLHYNLYTNPAHTIVWGDGTGGSMAVSGNGSDVGEIVYGSIPAGQNPYVGTYSDTIIVTVTF